MEDGLIEENVNRNPLPLRLIPGLNWDDWSPIGSLRGLVEGLGNSVSGTLVSVVGSTTIGKEGIVVVDFNGDDSLGSVALRLRGDVGLDWSLVGRRWSRV